MTLKAFRNVNLWFGVEAIQKKSKQLCTELQFVINRLHERLDFNEFSMMPHLLESDIDKSP